MAEDYIAASHTWATSETITAARLNGNVSNVVDGLSGGSKAINVGKVLMNGTQVISSTRVVDATQVNSDNLRLDGNTISSTDTNGSIIIAPNGTGQIDLDKPLQFDIDAGLTAGTTQTQAGGLALTADVNEVSTCANADDTVVLPTAVAGMRITIINNGANRLQIFPASSDDLGNGVDTAGHLLAGDQVTFISYDATNWITEGGFVTHVFNIGDWNMDSTTTVNVAHGLGSNFTKVRSADVWIQKDDSSSYVRGSASATDDGNQVWVDEITSTNIILFRLTSGRFDTATYDATSFNRGFVQIEYKI